MADKNLPTNFKTKQTFQIWYKSHSQYKKKSQEYDKL